MDNRPIVSIIMPVYNTGVILKASIESILKQTYSAFELIIIDDGSNEETADICDQFGVMDRRVRVFHKKNEGTCCARNDGMKLAVGEYVTFCDHDDVYSPELLKTEVELMSSGEYDIVAVGAVHIYDDGKRILFGKNYDLKSRGELEKNIVSIITEGILGTIWNVMYKKSIVQQIKFNTKYRKGHEDIAFNLDALSYIRSFRSIEKPLYNHYIRKRMSTSAGFHQNGLEAMIDINNKVSDIIEKFGSADINAIALQGEYLRTCTAYSIYLDYNYVQFRSMVENLKCCFRNNKIKNKAMLSKDIFVYVLVCNKQYHILYIMLFLYNKCFKH